jgi:hypothetical protein
MCGRTEYCTFVSRLLAAVLTAVHAQQVSSDVLHTTVFLKAVCCSFPWQIMSPLKGLAICSPQKSTKFCNILYCM